MSVIGLPPPTASEELFRVGGDYYLTLPKLLFHELRQLLPNDELAAAVNAAIKVMAFLVEMDWEHKLDPLLTDRVIADQTGISQRSVQRGLWALDVVLGTIGKPIIKRMRSHGRRIISFVRGFAARGQVAPPCTPQKTQETTTTSKPSSSLLETGKKDQGGKTEIPAELIDRAMRLIPNTTQGKVTDAVLVYGADWVKGVLDLVEKRNKKDGSLPVRSWGFVINTLKNWKREGAGPAEAETARPPAVKAPVPAPPEPPPHKNPLTPAELEELVCNLKSHVRPTATFARLQILSAIKEGLVPAEQMATIPAEIVEEGKPRAP